MTKLSVPALSGIKRWIAGLLACVLLFAAFVTANYVQVGMYKWQASRFINRWIEAGVLPVAAESNLVIGSLAKAISLRPQDPDLNEKMGMVWEWQAIYDDDVDREQIAIQKSLAYYRRSTQLRPTWPYGWAKIVSLNLMQQNYGDEFQLALRYAQRFGPYERFIHVILLKAGLVSWPQLDSETRAAVIANIGRYYEVSPDEVIADLTNSKRILNICASENLPDNVTTLCRKLQAAATQAEALP